MNDENSRKFIQVKAQLRSGFRSEETEHLRAGSKICYRLGVRMHILPIIKSIKAECPWENLLSMAIP